MPEARAGARAAYLRTAREIDGITAKIRTEERAGNPFPASIGTLEGFLDMRAGHKRLAAVVGDAELMWVTPDMTRAALDASRDLPADWTLSSAQPWPAGLLAWELPLPPVPFTEKTRLAGFPAQAPLDAVLWGPWTDGQMLVRLLTLTDRLPALQTHLTHQKAPGTRFAVIAEWGVPAEAPLNAVLTITDPIQRQVLAVLGTTWLLSQQPTVATRSRTWRDPDPNQVGRPPRPTPEVTVVDLRPLRHVTPDPGDPDPAGREWTHRWIVRGHWREQAHGPGRTLRRRTWVPSYIKGPDGAPLRTTEHIHRWSR